MNWKDNNDLLIFQRAYDVRCQDMDTLCTRVIEQHYKELDVSNDTSMQTSDPELLDEPDPKFSEE